jgi:tetratricopeptide (TPR) repeat protein
VHHSSMAADGQKRWLIKDNEGRVRGPFFTDDVLKMLSSRELQGEESIALYPSTDWHSISSDPSFYDKLLEILEREQASLGSDEDVRPKTVLREPEPPKNNNTNTGSQTAKRIENTATPIPNAVKRAKVSQESNTERVEPKIKATRIEQKTKSRDDQPIELKRRVDLVRDQKKQKSYLPAFLMLLILGGGFYWLFLPTKKLAAKSRHLVSLQAGKPAQTDDVIQTKLKSALVEFSADQHSRYLKAQDLLVGAIEGKPTQSSAIAVLCLTYLELWPLSVQDSQDIQTIATATQWAAKLNPAGIDTATCRTVDLLTRGNLVDAKSVIDNILSEYQGSEQPPVAFYYFKAILLTEANEFAAAASYAGSAHQLWSTWLRAKSYQANATDMAGNPAGAAAFFQSILQANKDHKESQLRLGILQLKKLKNIEVGVQLLKTALATNEKVAPSIESEANLAMAEWSLQSGKRPEALKYAQGAYATNANNARAREIIMSLGGASALASTKIQDTQLVYDGDQLRREGDCQSAQAFYQRAYTENPKNGVAALKAAECLWQLSLTAEAYEWLDKAIGADPKLIDAYVTYSDYLTQRYNFESAAKILQKAKVEMPKHYKVMRGFAQFEQRRNNHQGAVTYADTAIKIFESDVDSYILLSQSLIQTQEYARALSVATKATEIDQNNRDAQIALAEALALTRGFPTGLDRMEKIVATYPTIVEYRMALGRLYFQDQQYNKAKEIFDQVVRIDEKPKAAHVELGKIYQAQNLVEESLKEYLTAAQMDPADPEPLFFSGQLLLQANKGAEAAKQFSRVIRVNAEYPLVYYYLGKAALMSGDLDTAIENVKKEKMKNPGLADPYLLAAEIYTEQKQYSLCAAEYQQAVKIRSANAPIFIKMAKCYRLSGNGDAAVAMIEQAHQQDSGNPDLWREQGAIYDMRGEKIKAIEAYNQYLTLMPNALDRSQVMSRISQLSNQR